MYIAIQKKIFYVITFALKYTIYTKGTRSLQCYNISEGNNEAFQIMNLINYVMTSTTEYIEQMPKMERKKCGQFFTSKESAIFMADLFDLQSASGTVSILDPGAGSGILSAALIQRIQSVSSITKINLVCYENNTNILKLLQANLDWISAHSSKEIEYKVISDNYILCQSNEYNHILWEDVNPLKFDFIIGNPSYMKLQKDAPEALAMSDVCYGMPNLYFLFASMSMFNLKDNGELVYIIPRSWTSGSYFRKFRQKFLSVGVLEHIHLFVNRDKVFDEEKVLQETIIIKAKKTTVKPQNITITTTESNADFFEKKQFSTSLMIWL